MTKNKNILIISASDPYKSAGIVALDLYYGLSNIKGNKVKLITKFCKTQSSDIISFLNQFENYFERIKTKLEKMLFKLNLKKNKLSDTHPDYHILDFDQTRTYYKTNSILKKSLFQPTHIIVLFTQNFISFKNIFELSEFSKARVYLYPMDMSHFTGACHYAWDCNGYKNNCNDCPAIYSQRNKAQATLNMSFKTNYIQKTDITLFACNSQIKKQIEYSTIFKNKRTIGEIYPIPNRNIFFPENKSVCKKDFTIEPDQLVFFFGAVSQKDKRKGMGILKDALSKLIQELEKLNFDSKKITFLTAGTKCHINEWPTSKFNFIELGYVTDYKILAKAYNASDFFISSSIEETGPTMVLQSILCQTLVISFDLGYINEFYSGKLRRFIANEKDSDGLMKVIKNAIFIDENLKQELKQELNLINAKLDFNLVMDKINNSLK